MLVRHILVAYYMRNDKYFVCCRDGFSPSFLPQVGMEFSSTEKAWIFCVPML
jgi:hypothetical protein